MLAVYTTYRWCIYASMYQCADCTSCFDKLQKLAYHAKNRHGTTFEQTYVATMLCGVKPKCACGCGETPRFYTISAGYSRFVGRHHTRVINNWGHNPTARENSRVARKASYVRGEWKTWNDGLTAETDERVAAAGRKESATLQADHEERKRRANMMRACRLDGRIPTLTGSAHPQWNGGTSALSAHCHGHSKLYTTWKYPKLLAANFTCQRCSGNDRLEVHHCGERMAAIIKRFADQLGYDGTEATQHLKHAVAEAVATYHIEADVHGVVLCQRCHDLEHAAPAT